MQLHERTRAYVEKNLGDWNGKTPQFKGDVWLYDIEDLKPKEAG